MSEYKAIGWVVEDTLQQIICTETNHQTRSGCIHHFVKWWCAQAGVERDWQYISKKEAYRCLRVYRRTA